MSISADIYSAFESDTWEPDEMDNPLFSLQPEVRLRAAMRLDHHQKEQVLKDYRTTTVKDHGAANAWVIVVGPSYGAKKRRKHSTPLSSQAERHLVLGTVHESFVKLSQELVEPIHIVSPGWG